MSDDELRIDEYQLLNCIATGGASQVWEAREDGDSQNVVLKLLLPEAFADSSQVQTLKHEAKVGKSLDHPNFVQFHKLVVGKEHAYIVMDFFRAPNLKGMLVNDRMAIHIRIRQLVEALCLSIGYLHEQGWVHRDIKPDNVLINKGSEVRLIDFSLAMRLPTGLGKMLASKPKTIQGTRTYIAPETLRKQMPTAQTDMYSLGVTLFEVLTGEPPFRGNSPNDLLQKHLKTTPPPPSAINSNVTPEMDRLVLRLLAKKVTDRHKDMNEVYAEFRSLKVFKEPVEEIAERARLKAEEEERDSLDRSKAGLDSRSDARRSELGLNQTSQPAASEAAGKPAPTPPPPQQQQPAQPQPPQPSPAPQGQPAAMQHNPGQHNPGQQQPYPQQPYPPQQYPPGQYPPQQYPPQQYPPGAGYPPQFAGQPYPQQGGPPPQQYPPGQYPQQPPPPQQPQYQQPPAQQPPPPQHQAPAGSPPPHQQPPQQRPPQSPQPAAPRPLNEVSRNVPEVHPSSEKRDDDDLPLMDELPDIL